MTDQMKWASALSIRPSLEAAVGEVVEQAQRSLQAPADLGLVFISSAFASEFSRLLPLLQERLSLPALIGCSGGGVIGVNQSGEAQEVEQEAGLSLSLAHLPDVKVQPFHISSDDLPDLDSPPSAWVDLTGIAPEDEPQFVLLSDPFSSGINDLLQGLDYAYPGSAKVGGLASVSSITNSSTLFFNDQVIDEGTVGVALSGNIVMETIVAQGCRPIGQTYRVAEGERNIVLSIEEQVDADALACGMAKTPLEVLQSLFQNLSDEDRALAQHSLFVGIARNEFKQHLEQGDFLIRNLLGVDPKVGAIAIGDRVRPGQRIQFHLRDAQASAEDLEMMLERYQQNTQTNFEAAGALLFSCVGRGQGLYGQPNFDSHLFSRYLRNIPVSGFFCGGEIGPVGDATFLHGYTSVFGICRQPSEKL
jgi:small ligand-binding sensory domain FIST